MRTRLALFLAVLLAAPALAQDRGARERQLHKQGAQPREQRREMHRERRERRDSDRHHFSRAERDKLRQDLIDANRDLKGRK